MNPLYSGTVTCAAANSSLSSGEPKNTAEKIGRHLEQMNRQGETDYLRDMVYRLQREGAEAIRMLSEEIDALKVEVAVLKEPKVSGGTNG